MKIACGPGVEVINYSTLISRLQWSSEFLPVVVLGEVKLLLFSSARNIYAFNASSSFVKGDIKNGVHQNLPDQFLRTQRLLIFLRFGSQVQIVNVLVHNSNCGNSSFFGLGPITSINVFFPFET